MLQNNLEIETHNLGKTFVFYNDGFNRTLMGLLESVRLYTEKGVQKTQLIFRGHPVMCKGERSTMMKDTFAKMYGPENKPQKKAKKPHAKAKK